MFDFKAKKLNPIIKDAVGDIDAALATESVPDEIENLLAAKESADKKLGGLVDGEMAKGGAVLLGVAAVIVASLFAAVTAPLGAALGAASLGISAIGILHANKKVMNSACAKRTREAVSEAVNSQVAQLAAGNAGEAMKSPRYCAAIAAVFNAASGKDHLQRLRAHIALIPAPAVVRHTP
jgi:hypothetical protein